LKRLLKNSGAKSNKVFIIPSRFGIFYLLTLFLGIIISVSFGHPFSYFFSSLMFVLFVISSFISNNYLKTVEVKVIPGDFLVEQNSLMAIKLIIESKSDEILNCDISISNSKKKSVLVNGKSTTVTYYVNFEQWGEIKDLKIGLSSSYPFFLFYTWKYFKMNEAILVYPKVEKAQLNKLKDNTLHEYSDIELDKYQKGDSLSRVNWKKFSQSGKLYIKQDFGGDSEINLLEESLLEKIERERAIGLLCYEIEQHLRKYRSFAFIDKDNHFRIISKNKNMLALAKRLINEK
jgi:hypothetical protein